MEIWKDIEGYEGLYQVSSEGMVKSLNYNRTGKERILKSAKDKYGYLFVKLRKEGTVKYYLIHRLIAIAFIPNPDNKPCIDHINGDKTDNRVENLRWVTHKENMNNPITLNKIGKHLRKSILQFSVDGNFIKTWESIMDVQREYDIDKSAIIRCCKNKQNTSCGYIWQYLDDYELIPFKVFDLEMYRKKVA